MQNTLDRSYRDRHLMLQQEMVELKFEAVVYCHSVVTENIPLTSK